MRDLKVLTPEFKRLRRLKTGIYGVILLKKENWEKRRGKEGGRRENEREKRDKKINIYFRPQKEVLFQ